MLGDQIKQLRTNKNLTQAQLAIKLGVTKQAINSWENNKRNPSVDILKRIAEFFSCSTDSLLELEQRTNFIETTHLTLEQALHIQQLINDMVLLNQRSLQQNKNSHK